MVIMAYGPAIFDAIERGEGARLRKLVDQAKKMHAEQGDLAKAIKAGDAALKKLRAKK